MLLQCQVQGRLGLGEKKEEKNKTPLQFLQGRKKEKERRGEEKKISKTRDGITSSQSTDGAIRGQILR